MGCHLHTGSLLETLASDFVHRKLGF